VCDETGGKTGQEWRSAGRRAAPGSLVGAALDAGATPLKPAAKSLWGYGGVVQAPDGTIWKVATSAKKDTGPATRRIDERVLVLGVADVVRASGSTSAKALPFTDPDGIAWATASLVSTA
jgi:hypothetical protein